VIGDERWCMLVKEESQDLEVVFENDS